MKQDTSIISIENCIKLITDVCLGFLYKQFKNMTKTASMGNSSSTHDYGCYTCQAIPQLLQNLNGDDNYKKDLTYLKPDLQQRYSGTSQNNLT
jgi:hypothetical protein